MAEYGTVPNGFSVKPLPVILAELENALITEFGPDFVQTAQSPAGQLNGVYSNAAARLWELAQDIYQSFDPDQAENLRLDMLAKIRKIERVVNEDDASFRKAITNEGRARIDLQDLERALAVIPGVTYFQVWTRDDTDALPPETPLCVAISGGDGEKIGDVIRSYIAPGVTLYGNELVETIFEGRCRSFPVLRPIEIALALEIHVKRTRDSLGCPPPSLTAIKAEVLNALYFLNGEDASFYKIRQMIESQFPNVEVIFFVGERDGIVSPPNETVTFGFIERAILSAENLLLVDAI